MPVGRPSIFGPKTVDIHGQVTRLGGQRFEAARRALANLSGRRNVSDGDVIEYLAHKHSGIDRFYFQEQE